ncbi:MAG: GDSL-type esterase/lipase family protein [Bacteroidota bacterium]
MTNKLILLALFVCAMILMSYKYDKKKKVVFFGDSITEAAVNPGGYIRLIDTIIQKEGLTSNYELIGAGISGNKVYDLYLRLEKDVLEKSPDIVIIYIGVNDVWHKMNGGTGTDYDKFGKFYDAVVKKIKASGAKIILATPAAIGERTDNSNQQDGDLNLYCNWIRKYALDNALQLVDLRAGLMEYNLKNNHENKERGILTSDRVHLNPTGQQFVAEAMWNEIKKIK